MLIDTLAELVQTMERHAEELHAQWLAALEVESKYRERREHVERLMHAAKNAIQWSKPYVELLTKEVQS